MGSAMVEPCYICIVRSEYVRPGCRGSVCVRGHTNRDSASITFNSKHSMIHCAKDPVSDPWSLIFTRPQT